MLTDCRRRTPCRRCTSTDCRCRTPCRRIADAALHVDAPCRRIADAGFHVGPLPPLPTPDVAHDASAEAAAIRVEVEAGFGAAHAAFACSPFPLLADYPKRELGPTQRRANDRSEGTVDLRTMRALLRLACRARDSGPGDPLKAEPSAPAATGSSEAAPREADTFPRPHREPPAARIITPACGRAHTSRIAREDASCSRAADHARAQRRPGLRADQGRCHRRWPQLIGAKFKRRKFDDVVAVHDRSRQPSIIERRTVAPARGKRLRAPTLPRSTRGPRGSTS